jgi:hypothetical protein
MSEKLPPQRGDHLAPTRRARKEGIRAMPSSAPSVPRRESSLGNEQPKGWATTMLGDLLVALESGSRPRGGARGISEGVPSIGGEHLRYDGRFDFSSVNYVPNEFAAGMTKGRSQTSRSRRLRKSRSLHSPSSGGLWRSRRSCWARWTPASSGWRRSPSCSNAFANPSSPNNRKPCAGWQRCLPWPSRSRGGFRRRGRSG